MQHKLFTKLLCNNLLSAQRNISGMDIFIQKFNPLSGKTEWLHKNEDSYDYQQEISNAGFGDMLHDKERNQKYFAALKDTIKYMHDKGKEVHVLDIGTGTGILAMMSVQAGADSVTACEAFMPMADCAERILKANNCDDKVKLIKKRSTDMKVGIDMKRKANLLVAEVLDTELIGEGAISIYNHAHDNLLTEDVICIPAKARCYAQVVQLLLPQWNTLKVLANLDGEILLIPPKNLADCKGEAVLHDMQLSQLPAQAFISITEPIKIFEFDFTRKPARESQRSLNLTLLSQTNGTANAIFFWWDIIMDPQAQIVLSCAPFWAQPEYKTLKILLNSSKKRPPWRDHWIQAVYYIPKPLKLHHEEKFILHSNHDEYSWWFDAFPFTKNNLNRTVERHSCTCNFHRTYSRSRIGQLNEATRSKRYLRYLEANIDKNAKVLLLGDGCLLGLVGSCYGASKIFCHEPHKYSQQFMQSMVEANKLENIQFIQNLEELTSDSLSALTHIFAEPYYLTSILPWDNLCHFGAQLNKIYNSLSATIQIMPYAANIYAIPVEFFDLHKIRMPVKECEGFDVTLFDEMVANAKSLTWCKVEAQPLWEYPCRALAKPHCLLNITFDNFNLEKFEKTEVDITQSGSCNGLCLWVDWLLDNTGHSNSVISSGPTVAIEPGHLIQWNMFVRQGVHLMSQPHFIEVGKSFVQYSVKFSPQEKQFNFNFYIKKR